LREGRALEGLLEALTIAVGLRLEDVDAAHVARTAGRIRRRARDDDQKVSEV
jgi:hypothetical protein